MNPYDAMAEPLGEALVPRGRCTHATGGVNCVYAWQERTRGTSGRDDGTYIQRRPPAGPTAPGESCRFFPEAAGSFLFVHTPVHIWAGFSHLHIMRGFGPGSPPGALGRSKRAVKTRPAGTVSRGQVSRRVQIQAMSNLTTWGEGARRQQKRGSTASARMGHSANTTPDRPASVRSRSDPHAAMIGRRIRLSLSDRL